MTEPTAKPIWEQAHSEASSRGESTYIDPETGRIVLTEAEHLRRGYCCKSGCRHCPYGFAHSSRSRE